MSGPAPTGPITGATGLATGLSRSNDPASLKKAGQQFEASFTQMMLKSMRQAKLADPLFDSSAIDTFTEMGDARVAQAMAEHQPIGIGQAVTAFLSKAQAKAAPATDAAPPP